MIHTSLHLAFLTQQCVSTQLRSPVFLITKVTYAKWKNQKDSNTEHPLHGEAELPSPFRFYSAVVGPCPFL